MDIYPNARFQEITCKNVYQSLYLRFAIFLIPDGFIV